MTRGTLFQIQRFSTQDGPGIRTTVFLKGCPLRCAWCHNPESQALSPEPMFAPERCVGCARCGGVCRAGGPFPPGDPRCEACGACAAVCPADARTQVGWETSVDALVREILKDRAFFEESGGGVTFSGGEPLMQPEFLGEVIAALRREEIPLALDTCGAAPLERLLQMGLQCDLVLFDLKGWDHARHQAQAGVDPEPIRRNLKALAAEHPNVWLRLPIIPGCNDHPEDWEALVAFVGTLPTLRRVHLMPYHALGASKRKRLGKGGLTFEAPSPEHLESLAMPFRALGLDVQLGG